MGCWHMLFGLLLLIAASAFDWKPGCPETVMCGNVSIRYPFGIKEGCSREGFKLECNETEQKPFWGEYEIMEITLEGQANVTAYVASDCYNESGSTDNNDPWMWLSKDGPFAFSSTRNKFTAIGCDTQAYITATYVRSNFTTTTGCVSLCEEEASVIDGLCTGSGCCQTSIPPGAWRFDIRVTSFNNHSGILDFNPCSHAFLIADDQFKFNISDLSAQSKYNNYPPGNYTGVPVVLDWGIWNETCEQAKENPTSNYACKGFSTCYNPTTDAIAPRVMKGTLI